jgi:putative membrane protein insertion efficiency factor
MLIAWLLGPTLLMFSSAPTQAQPIGTGWDPAELLFQPSAATPEKVSYSGASTGLHLIFSGYRNTVSKVRGPCCSFVPSCSRYSEEAVTRFGFVKGVIMTADRLERCNPCIRLDLYPRGLVNQDGRTLAYDPVEDHDYWHSSRSTDTALASARREEQAASGNGEFGPNAADTTLQTANSKPQTTFRAAPEHRNAGPSTGWEKDVLSYCTDHSYHAHDSGAGGMPIAEPR